jgi:hypothetical protein
MESAEGGEESKSAGRVGGVVHIGLSRINAAKHGFCLLRFYAGLTNINSAFNAIIANNI